MTADLQRQWMLRRMRFRVSLDAKRTPMNYGCVKERLRLLITGGLIGFGRQAKELGLPGVEYLDSEGRDRRFDLRWPDSVLPQ